MRLLPRLVAFAAVLALLVGVGWWVERLPPPARPPERPLRVVDPPSPRLPWLGTLPAPSSASMPDLARSLPSPTIVPRPRPAPAQPAELVPPQPLPGRPPSPDLLARASARLREPRRELSLGPYLTVTDVTDPALVARLDGLAGQVEDLYRRRYGLSPVGDARETIVLYAREEDYRQVAREDERIAAIASAGHTVHGLVMLYAGERPADEIGATLVHELVHLLNRRALGPALPPWLDEGIAEDLAQSRADASGALVPGTLSGSATPAADHIELRGALAGALMLQRALAAGKIPRVETLIDSPWEEFVAAGRQERYDAAFFWVRYLQEGEGGGLRPAFTSYLGGIAAGGSVDGEELRRRLGRPWPLLDLGWHAWLQAIDVRALAAEAR